jgi:hypothetical protein
MAKRAKSGHWFGGGGNAVVVLRKTGQVLNNVVVKNPTFAIVTPDLGPRVFKTTRLKTIVYKNLPAYPTDMLRLLDGTELNGRITDDPVTIATLDLGEVAIPKANILSIIW